MYKCAAVTDPQGLEEARNIMQKIYREEPSYWPYGVSPEAFDGGVYLIREKRSNTACGFAGWQVRVRPTGTKSGSRYKRVGYYSIGILPEHRRNGYAKEALAKLIEQKADDVDEVQALIMASNGPSLALADVLGVEKQVKAAAVRIGWQTPV